MGKIPKLIHQVWIGPKEPPSILMNSFVKMYDAIQITDPNIIRDMDKWYYILWTEELIDKYIDMINRNKYDRNIPYCGKCDIVRYEILLKYGGIFFDADCLALKRVTDDMLSYSLISVFENERKNKYIAVGIIGVIPENPVIRKCVSIIRKTNKTNPAWKYLGPELFTRMYNLNHHLLESSKIYPSYYFLPQWLKSHQSQIIDIFAKPEYIEYIYGNHYWGTTKDDYSSGTMTNFFFKYYPKISVVLPFYNDDLKILEETLDSIISQTIPYYIEVIIVDDGSSEDIYNNLQELVRIYNTKDMYIQFNLHRLDSNRGLPSALNYGINKASSNLIARIDSDDIMMPDRLLEQYNFFKENSEVDVLGTSIEIFRDRDRITTGIKCHPRIIDKVYIKRNKVLWFLNHPSVMFKKDVVLKCGGYNENHSDFPEDFDLWLRILKNNYKIYNLDKVLTRYRRKEKNKSDNLGHRFKNDMLRMIKNL